ncbi:unnamed protein product, partial [Laminaria digitata]
MRSLAARRLMPASQARCSPRYQHALIASALCGSVLALVRAEAASAGGALQDSPRVDFKSNNKHRDDRLELVGEGAGAAGVTPAGKAGLYVPLTKRPRSDGAVYGVDVGVGGISRRRLGESGVGIEEA